MEAIIIVPVMTNTGTHQVGTHVSAGNIIDGDGHRVVTFANGEVSLLHDDYIVFLHSQIAVEAVPMCVACHDNAATDHHALCNRCVQMTMEALSIERAINKLINCDDRIEGTMTYDKDEETRSPVPYVSIRDAAYDWAHGTSEDELTTIVTRWVPSIVNAMLGG